MTDKTLRPKSRSDHAEGPGSTRSYTVEEIRALRPDPDACRRAAAVLVETLRASSAGLGPARVEGGDEDSLTIIRRLRGYDD